MKDFATFHRDVKTSVATGSALFCPVPSFLGFDRFGEINRSKA
jgi:hypothetical protein